MDVPVWLGSEPLLLASTSETRRVLLVSAGLPVETMPPGLDERAVERGLSGDDARPDRLAARLARDKALAVSRERPERVVVGADQVLDIDGRAMGKAASAAEAVANLERLAGRSHRLHSAFALARNGALLREGRADATLTLRTLDRPALARYVDGAGAAALRSAGGYEVEGLGIHLFERIQGEHSTILGLPMLPLLAALRALGLLGI